VGAWFHNLDAMVEEAGGVVLSRHYAPPEESDLHLYWILARPPGGGTYP
jgi:hypothetical protein